MPSTDETDFKRLVKFGKNTEDKEDVPFNITGLNMRGKSDTRKTEIQLTHRIGTYEGKEKSMARYILDEISQGIPVSEIKYDDYKIYTKLTSPKKSKTARGGKSKRSRTMKKRNASRKRK